MSLHVQVHMSCSSVLHVTPDTGDTNAYTLALELFLLHKEFNHCTLANKYYWQPCFFQNTAEKLIKKHTHQIQEM